MTRTRLTTALCAALLTAASFQVTAGAGPATATGPEAAAAPEGAPHRPCVASPPPDGGPAAEVLRIAEQAKQELDLKSVILRVTRDGHELVTAGLGESMTGVPAEPAMHFRAGSVGIAFMGTTLLQLVDEGVVGLDDPVSRWLPDLPHGDEITLRMLGSSTTGIADYVTDPDFLAALYAAPFRQWTPQELVDIALARPRWYDPGTNWSYSHANFVLLGEALEKITGIPLDRLLQQRIYRPLGLHETFDGTTPEIPAPVQHAFTSDRGIYEESTFWNPSWTTVPGAVITTDICDLARSAVGIGAGELLSPHSYQELLNPGTVGLGGATKTCPADICLENTEQRHFGFTAIVVNDWVLQNPSFTGFAAIQAYLPCERLAIAVSVTKGPNAPDVNSADTIASRISEALAPDHPLQFG
ncbi:serine hydrolase domain-containing protein [Kitasatospora sp. NPDC058170]|uniref:serine hydrolase domain-containing protein n=1 Tax=Kitasatospora sp. NPDC058170 TaxID=3346364 RepID=UPI0036DB7C7E